MKKLFWIALFLVIVSVAVSAVVQKYQQSALRNAEIENRERATRSAISQMVERTNAIKDWETQLAKSEDSWEAPILTIDLEKVWLQTRPLLFMGEIVDIRSLDESRYLVSMTWSPLSSSPLWLIAEENLSLVSSRSALDAFLADHPNLLDDYGIHNKVAVVAKILRIKSNDESGAVRTGEGELLDIEYVGDSLF